MLYLSKIQKVVMNRNFFFKNAKRLNSTPGASSTPDNSPTVLKIPREAMKAYQKFSVPSKGLKGKPYQVGGVFYFVWYENIHPESAARLERWEATIWKKMDFNLLDAVFIDPIPFKGIGFY